MKETLRTYERMQKRQTKTTTETSKFRQLSAPTYTLIPSKTARAVRAIHVGGEDSSSESDMSSSDSDEEQRRVYIATAADQATNQTSGHPIKPKLGDREHEHDRAAGSKSCTHCGSKRHDDRGCWKRLTCQKCGRRGHPSDKCYYGCAACGEVHEGGKCPMEKFYNMLRKWYVPNKHAGMLPPEAEKMLN